MNSLPTPLNFRGLCLALALCRAVVPIATADTPAPSPVVEAPDTSDKDLQSLIGLDEKTWSIAGQATYIDQGHGSFPAAYSGPESLSSKEEIEHTFSFSLFLDRALWTGADLVYNPELFQGHGLGGTLGVAGFPNGEAVKSGYAQLKFSSSRLMLRQVIGLGGEKEKIDRGPSQLSEQVDVNRITISAGKFSATDTFDDNAYSHDPRTQFMNWALWESAAWDYPGDSQGFVPGTTVEWNRPQTTLHYGIFMEPSAPNSSQLDGHVTKAHGQFLEYEIRYLAGKRSGTLRPFVFWNQNMAANYRLVTEAAESTGGTPDPVPFRSYRSKVGAGISWDQEILTDVGAFSRLSWNDGRTESWAFTQIDRSAVAGLSFKGGLWKRTEDVLGVAVAVNAISPEQQAYLAAGGTGLIIGDGALSYETERILETYYAFQANRWLQLTADYQYVANPAYNAARGPVSFYSVRMHVQF